MGTRDTNPYNVAGNRWKTPENNEPVSGGADAIHALGNDVADAMLNLEGRSAVKDGSGNISVNGITLTRAAGAAALPGNAVVRKDEVASLAGSSGGGGGATSASALPATNPADGAATNTQAVLNSHWDVISSIKKDQTPKYVKVMFERTNGGTVGGWNYHFKNIPISWVPAVWIGPSNSPQGVQHWIVYPYQTGVGEFWFQARCITAYSTTGVYPHWYNALLLPTGQLTGGGQAGPLAVSNPSDFPAGAGGFAENDFTGTIPHHQPDPVVTSNMPCAEVDVQNTPGAVSLTDDGFLVVRLPAMSPTPDVP